MSSKHGPNSWDDYLNVHQRRIASFVDHFILADRLEFTRTATQVLWEGEILCVDGIEVHVRKRQSVRYRNGRPWVRTEDYSYQVLRRSGTEVTQMFRYDNSDHFDHPDAHHRHQFDATGVEIHPAVHVGERGWPTLGDVLEEARSAWLATTAE
jgi:hypothetical protein